MQVSPDGQLAVCASEDASVRCWHMASGECRHDMLGHTGWVVALAVSSDSGTVLSASHDTTAR